MNGKIIVSLVAAGLLIGGAVWLSSLSRTGPIQPVKQSEIVHLKDGERYTLTARYVTMVIAGKEQRMLAYNGMIPGPEIHVAEGAAVTIDFKNDTDMPALLHAHGVRMDNAFDGSQLQQKDIPPGDSFAYTLKFPDAGVFWYHPHANEVYGQPLGLYGAFVVAPADPGYFPPVNSEHVLFLSDLPLANGTIAINPDGKDHSLMGHYGNVFLVNGSEDYSLSAKTGEVMRLDVINAANARPYNFAITGARLKLVGGDNGGYEKAAWRDSVILGPSERAIVDVMFPKAATYAIQNRKPTGTDTLGRIIASTDTAEPSFAAEFDTLQGNDAVRASIDPFRPYFDKPADKKIVLSVDFSGMMAGHMQSMGGSGMGMHAMNMGGSEDDSTSLTAGGIEWDDSAGMMQMMNSMANAAETKWKITDAATGKSNMDIDWTLARGKPVKIEIYNDPASMHPMQHPIHFHGQRFLVLSVNGVRQMNLAWKDTALIPAGGVVDILLDPSNPGVWMAHCHIAEHLQANMMFAYKVE